MVEVVWTKLAVEQLERAVKYIQKEQGTYYANIVLNQILKSGNELQFFPKRGQIEYILKYKKVEY